MKCPECERQGQRSFVYDGGSARTMGAVQRYWDEDGVEHVHDGNVTTTAFWCSNGHRWSQRIKWEKA